MKWGVRKMANAGVEWLQKDITVWLQRAEQRLTIRQKKAGLLLFLCAGSFYLLVVFYQALFAPYNSKKATEMEFRQPPNIQPAIKPVDTTKRAR
jgi:hypothetical protein